MVSKRAANGVTPSLYYAMDSAGFEIPKHNKRSALPQIQQRGKQGRCVPCQTDPACKHKKDSKTTSVCDLCVKYTCKDHFIRVCESCWLNGCTSVEADRTGSPSNDESTTTSMSFSQSASASSTSTARKRRAGVAKKVEAKKVKSRQEKQ